MPTNNPEAQVVRIDLSDESLSLMQVLSMCNEIMRIREEGLAESKKVYPIIEGDKNDAAE